MPPLRPLCLVFLFASLAALNSGIGAGKLLRLFYGRCVGFDPPFNCDKRPLQKVTDLIIRRAVAV